MKSMLRLYLALSVVLLVGLASAGGAIASGRPPGPISPGGRFADMAGHWAEAAIVRAAQAGWVNGYPDETFRPDDFITRAEFVKLLLAAEGLAPDAPGTETLVQTADWSGEVFFDNVPGGDCLAARYLVQPPLADVSGHWLSDQGWLSVAQSLGIVVASDYTNGHSFVAYHCQGNQVVPVRDVAVAHFAPDAPISRREAAVMIVRALGGVYGAEHPPAGSQPAFADADQLPGWAMGYIGSASAAGVIKGYPDGSFRPDAGITRAEAVTMIARAETLMASGADPALQVYVQMGVQQIPVELDRPAYVVDGHLLLSVQAVLDAGQRAGGVTDTTWTWQPVTQTLSLMHGKESWVTFRAGRPDAYYGSFLERRGTADARLIDGQLYAAMDAFYPYGATYDATAKTVVLPAFVAPPPPPGPS